MEENKYLIETKPSNENSPSSDDLNLQTQQPGRTFEYLSDADPIFFSSHEDSNDTELEYTEQKMVDPSGSEHGELKHTKSSEEKVDNDASVEAGIDDNALEEQDKTDDETASNILDRLEVSDHTDISDKVDESDKTISSSAMEDRTVDVNNHDQQHANNSIDSSELFDKTDDEDEDNHDQQHANNCIDSSELFDETDDEDEVDKDKTPGASTHSGLFDDTDDEDEVNKDNKTPETNNINDDLVLITSKTISDAIILEKKKMISPQKIKAKAKIQCYLGNMVEWGEKMEGKKVTGKVHPNVINDRNLKNFWKEYPGGDDYPEGWIIHVHKRPSGNHMDWYWFTDKGQKFRSRAEITRYIEQINAGMKEDEAWELSATNSATHKSLLNSVPKSNDKIPAAKKKKTIQKPEKKTSVQDKKASKKATLDAKAKQSGKPSKKKNVEKQGFSSTKTSESKSEKRSALQVSNTNKKEKKWTRVIPQEGSPTHSTQSVADEKLYSIVYRVTSSKTVAIEKHPSSKIVASPSVEQRKRLDVITKVDVVPKRSRKDGKLPVDMQKKVFNDADLPLYSTLQHPRFSVLQSSKQTATLRTYTYNLFKYNMGKVHGSLARAGKVKGQTPKVEKQEGKKRDPRGRAKKRMQYNRRYVNVVTGMGGKKLGPNSNADKMK